jgi:biotin carboxylase
VHHLISRAELLTSYRRPATAPYNEHIAQNVDEAVEFLRCFVAARPDSIVLCGSEPGVEVVAAMPCAPSARSYNPPSASLSRANKYYMLNALKRLGLNTIRQLYTDDVEMAVAFHYANSGRTVVKPPHSAGSDQVAICHNAQEVVSTFEKSLWKTNALGRVNSNLIVQEYIDGDQYIVNGTMCDGLAIPGDIWLDRREWRDGKKVLDFELELGSLDPRRKRAADYAKLVLQAIELRNGPYHIELFGDGTDFHLIEVGARVMGSLSLDAYDEIFGCNPVDLHLDYVLDGRPPTEYSRLFAAVRCVTIRSFVPGVVQSDCLDFLQSLETFKGAYGIAAVGQVVEAYRDLFSNAGTAYLAGSAEAVERDYRAIRQFERIFCKPINALGPGMESAAC